MGEYQYYEFQAIDRLLTEEEQQAVAELSRRVDPHPRQAVFVYHWSGFPGDAEEILARYYDAMLYETNWGSRQLLFRFPLSVLDLESVAAYCQPLIVQDYVSLSSVDAYTLLNIKFCEEGRDEAKGEGWLPAMLSLRDDILRGDYRALCLAWLKTLEVEDLLDSVREPPVPPGLKDLTPALSTFIEFFEIDRALVKVAAEASHRRQGAPREWLAQAIGRLPREEGEAFLLRLARGEAHIPAKLNRRLQEIFPLPRPEPSPRRTVGQLLRDAEYQRGVALVRAIR